MSRTLALLGLGVVAAFAILYLLGRREDRAIRRDGEQLMSQRKKSPKHPGGPSHKA